MKTKKHRGQKKTSKVIDDWLKFNHLPSIDELNSYGKDVLNCNIDPWNRLNLTWSTFPQPKGDFKRSIIQGLIDKYEIWDTFLESRLENYELRLKIHSHQISKCAIEVVQLEKGEKSKYNYKLNEELNVDGLVIQGFRWDRVNDFMYLDDEALEIDLQSESKERAYIKRIKKKIKKYALKKNKFGDYEIPSGEYFVGIRE